MAASHISRAAVAPMGLIPMNEPTPIVSLQRAIVIAHLVQALVLVAMASPMVARFAEDMVTGDLPTWWSPEAVLRLAWPFALAAATLLGLVLWRRRHMRWPLVVIDLAAVLASWLLSLVFLFATPLPVVLYFVAPLCLAMAAAGAWMEDRPRRVR